MAATCLRKDKAERKSGIARLRGPYTYTQGISSIKHDTCGSWKCNAGVEEASGFIDSGKRKPCATHSIVPFVASSHRISEDLRSSTADA